MNSKNETKRLITADEIDYVLSDLYPNQFIPEATSISVLNSIKTQLKEQFNKIEIYPEILDYLKSEITSIYKDSLIQPGESVGFLAAQSIGEKQTQTTLNSFHKAGSSDKGSVSKFSELLNATMNPKDPCYTIFFNSKNSNIEELRESIGSSLVEIRLKKLAKKIEVCLNKENESWYDYFYEIYKNGIEKDEIFKHCLSIELNPEILYEYKLNIEDIASFFEKHYGDFYCIFSPDCFHKLDIFINTENVNFVNEKVAFIERKNYEEIYLEEVIKPVLEKTIISGISGITNIFFLQNKKEWIVETENSNVKEKISKKTKTSNISIDSVKRFRQVLSLPIVNFSKTLSNSIWDIYNIFGIEAVRKYMIDELCKIMEGINKCHVILLIDQMTFQGRVASISRYSMRNDDSSPFTRASFEETLDHFLNAGLYGQIDNIDGISSSIICGKKPRIGTGFCEFNMDLSKFKN